MTRRTFTALSYTQILGANDRIGLGYIGLGARGDRLHETALASGRTRTVAICDLFGDFLDVAQKKAGAGIPRHSDYRKLLDERGVDAVVIATPDHWHALMFIDACRAGKDVYIEKPMSLTVVEGRRMVEVARRTRRVVQVGTQRRSSPIVREAAELVRSGGIGRVTMIRAFDNLNEWPHGIGRAPAEAPPAGFDWEAWTGPARLRAYRSNRTWYNYRWFYDYSCGQITNNGIHLLDVGRWGLNATYPNRVAAFGGRFAIDDDREIPDTLQAMWQYGDSAVVTFTQLNGNEAPSNPGGADLEFRGTEGTLYLFNDRYEVAPESVSSRVRYRPSPLRRADSRAAWARNRRPGRDARIVRGPVLTDREHMNNFLDCCQSRNSCNADPETGHISTSTCILGSIALRTGETLDWDSRAERFAGRTKANDLLHYNYRSPYRIT